MTPTDVARAEVARRLADLPPEKRARLYEKLQREKAGAPGPARPRLVRRGRKAAAHPLSFAQQRLWFLNRFEPESPEYNIPQAFRVSGELDPEVLRRAVAAIVERHEVLRTTFADMEGEPVQVLHPPSEMGVELAIPLFDLSDHGEAAWAKAMEIAREDARRPFDLTAGPLLRARLFRLGEGDHLLYLNVHHIAYDGWSQGVFMGELGALYEAFAQGRPSPLPELPIQYLDYALWQREWLTGEVLAEQLDYWRRQLAGVEPLDLPTDRPRPAVHTHAGAARPLRLPRERVPELEALARSEGVTLFILLSAAFKALLHHHTTQEDLALGTLVANRSRPEIEALVGFFANTLVLRTDLAGDPTFRRLLAREREVALEALSRQDLPFEKLVDELDPPRDLARTPLFQAMLILLNAPGGRLELPGLTLATEVLDSGTSKLELTLYLTARETADGPALDGFMEYNTDLFDAATIDRMLAHLATILAAVTADPELRLSQLPLLSEEERRRMLVEWNATAAEVPGLPLHGLVEAQARERPGAPAVEWAGDRLSYQELVTRAGRLATHLTGLGVGPEVRVAVALERTLELPVAILGVLTAGGAYVPLDPEYPEERLALMLSDAEPAVLLTQSSLQDKLPAVDGPRRVEVDGADAEAIAAAPVIGSPGAPPRPAVDGEALAYVIYTSGSTGRPKGVQIPHAAVVNFLTSMARRPGLDAGDSLLAVTTLSFDIAGLELFLPLAVGGRVLLAPREVAAAGEELARVLSSSPTGSPYTPGVTAMQATPATWRLLLAAGWEGDERLKVLCGGEALPADLAERLRGAVGSLWNVYGPTEATIWSAVEALTGGDGPVAIGRPIANTRIYLLSRRLEPVPLGVPGELTLGGRGLTRGYRHRPALTADSLVPDAWSGEPGQRLYRTGDLARYLPDGRLQCLGRIDFQVKVRGFRIELGEIETALAQHPEVAQAVVTAREDTPGAKRLVAYLVAAGDEAPGVTELRGFLQQRLPEYMIPALFMPLAELPLTPNGKVDRRALPAPDVQAAAREYAAPRDGREQAMADIWAEVLSLDRVGIHDDFFELGGDSLLVIRVVTKANKAGLPITTKQAFQHRTVAELTAAAGTREILAEQGPVSGALPFTPAQLHFLELDHPHPHYHSLGHLLEPAEGVELDYRALEGALARLLQHHDSLRVRLLSPAERPRLEIDPPGAPPALYQVDLSALAAEDQVPAINRLVHDVCRSYDLERGPLFKTLVVELEAGRPRYLFLTAHFLPADVGSWNILLDDFDSAYRQLTAGEEAVLAAKTTAATQWAGRLAERARPGGMPDEEVQYWLEQAPENPARFPMDHDTGPNVWQQARVVPVELDEADSAVILQQAPRFFGVQIDALLVTAILSAFESWIGSRSLPILLLGHGREALYDDMDLTRTVGWFNTIYPAFLDMGPDPDLGATVREINRQLRRLPHGGTGYGLLRYLSPDPEIRDRLRRAPAPQVFFNYFGPDQSKELIRFHKIEGFGGYVLDREGERLCPITLGGYVIRDRLLIKWEHSLNLHRPETAQALARRSREVLDWFVKQVREGS